MKLTANFTLEEMTSSSSAKKYGIDNTIYKEQYKKNVFNLACMLQKVRDKFGEPIIVGSGYRCDKLNTKVGGVVNSDHRFAAAADIHTKSDKPTENKRLFDLIVSLAQNGEIECRQIIDEYNYNWVHVSINHPDAKNKKNQIVHIK